MSPTTQLARLVFVVLCSFQMACASMTIGKMKTQPGKIAATGVRVNTALTNEKYVPFLGDMNFSASVGSTRAKVEQDATDYRGPAITANVNEETRAYLTALHAKVIAESGKNLKFMPIEEVSAHKTFKTFGGWVHSFNKKVHLSLPPYRYPNMSPALIGGGKTKDNLNTLFTDLDLGAAVNMAYSFCSFHEQDGAAAADLSEKGPVQRSIGLVLKLEGRNAEGSVILKQEIMVKSDPIKQPAMGSMVDYTQSSKQYDEAAERLLEALRADLAQAS